MAVRLDKNIIELFENDETVKILATIDDKGVPHAVLKQTLHVNDEKNLVYLELLESSRTSKNLLRSLWFDRKVSATIKSKDNQSYQIIGKPVKALIAGPVFQKYYVDLREKLPAADLAVVWIIEPEEVYNQTFSVRQAQEAAVHPNFIHLDRLAK